METSPKRFESGGGAGVAPLVEALLTGGLSVEITATGSSMSPFIRPGDVVVLDPLGSRSVRIGDVLGFLRDPGRLAIHRVVAGADGHWRLRGDGAGVEDAPVEPGAIVGRLRTVHRKGSPVRLGFGPEQRLIALLSRTGVLSRLVRATVVVSRLTTRRRGR